MKKEEKNRPIPRMGYTFELFNIDAKSLGKFVFPENKRQTSKKQVSNIFQLLCKGDHFDSPIVVNSLAGLFRIIDGNHRIQSITRVINRYPNYSIPVLLIVYKGLDEDGEIEAFRRWNIGRIQSLDDFIQSISKKVALIKWIKDKFPVPVTIYKKWDTLSIKTLCNAYLASKRGDDIGHGLYKENFARELYELDIEDYKFMVEFCKNFSGVFSPPAKHSKYYRYCFFFAAMYISYEYPDKKDLWELFRERILGDAEILELANFTNREANRKMIALVKSKLRLKPKPLIERRNEKKKVNPFCPKCGSILTPSRVRDKPILKCSCGYTSTGGITIKG